MAGDKTDMSKFTAADMACMVAFMREAGVSFGNSHFAIMSKVDGKRTASSYEHQTRGIRTMATEIQKRMKNGDLKNASSAPAKNGKSPAKTATAAAASSSSKKRGNKRGRAAAGEDNSDTAEESPNKMAKGEDEKKGEGEDWEVVKAEENEEGNGLSYEFEFE